MSKGLNIFRMIEYLKNKGYVKRKDLQELLNLDKKTISEYVAEINESRCGLIIECKTGKFGGIKLLNEGISSNNFIVDEREYKSLIIAREMIKQNYGEVYSDINSLILKLESILDKKTSIFDFYCHTQKSNIDVISEIKKQDRIQSAIENAEKICIQDYKKLSNEIKQEERIVRPYYIVNYKGSSYLSCYCEMRKDIRFFKMNRIKKYKLINEKFDNTNIPSMDHILDKCIGMYRGKEYKLKLEISFPFDEIISEKIWSSDQKITKIDDQRVLFEGTLRGEEEILSWIFSMRGHVKIIEPEEIKNKVIQEIKKISEQYF